MDAVSEADPERTPFRAPKGERARGEAGPDNAIQTPEAENIRHGATGEGGDGPPQGRVWPPPRATAAGGWVGPTPAARRPPPKARGVVGGLRATGRARDDVGRACQGHLRRGDSRVVGGGGGSDGRKAGRSEAAIPMPKARGQERRHVIV